MTTRARYLDANWSPSRMNLATFKLLGYLLLKSKRSVAPDSDQFILNMAPQQNGFEAYTLALLFYFHLWMFVQFWLQTALGLEGRQAIMLLIVAAIPLLVLIALAILAVIVVADPLRILIRARVSPLQFNTAIFWLIPTVLSFLALRSNGWVRLFGVTWLLLLGLNALCALIVRMLGSRIQEVGDRYQ